MDGEAKDLVLVPREDTLFVRVKTIHNPKSANVVDDALAFAGGVPKIIFALLGLISVHPGDVSTAVRCQRGHMSAGIRAGS